MNIDHYRKTLAQTCKHPVAWLIYGFILGIVLVIILLNFFNWQEVGLAEEGKLPGIIAYLVLLVLLAILIFDRLRAVHLARQLKHELMQRKLAEVVVQSVDSAMVVADRNTTIVKVNPAFCEITGYSAEEAIGKKTTLLNSGAHDADYYRAMWDSINKNGTWQGEIFNRRKNGELYIEWLSINAVRDEEGLVTNYVALFSDISQRKAEEAHLHNLAHYDPLTGLPNRILLADRLQQAIAGAKRDRHLMALMFVDLDQFKPINDTQGHHIGDIILKDVANRMLGCVRETDTAARIGGDEFVVLLPEIEKIESALSVAEKIRHALTEKFIVGGRTLHISCSIGVAVYPEHGADERTLLKTADIAMYTAKASGKNQVVLYAPTMKR